MKKNNVINFPITYSVIKDDSYNSELFTKVNLKVMHNKLNYNMSNFEFENINKPHIIKTLQNCPILAYIKDDDFDEHNMEYDEDEDKMIYHEKIIGVIPESNNYRYEEIDGLTYVLVDGYIYNTYASDAIDIINENPETKISMEIKVKSLKYIENDVMDITDYIYTGITCLGRDVESGMKNSVLTVDKFSQQEDFNKDFSEMKKLVNFSLNTSKSDTNDFKEEEKKVAIKKKDIALKFALTASQLSNELNKTLSKETFENKDYWGEEYECSRFYMRDYDENFVYAVDRAKEYQDVKIPYSKQGDNVSFDFDQVTRIKFVPTDWEGVNSEDDVEEDDDGIENYAKKMVEEFTQTFEEAKNKINEKQSEIDQKVSDYIELNEKFSEKDSAISKLEQSISEKDEKINELNSFKLEKQNQEKKEKLDEVLNKLSKVFNSEELAEWKEKADKVEDYVEFEKEIKNFAFDRLISENKDNDKKAFTMDNPKNRKSNEEKEDEDVEDVFSKYKV